MGLAYGLRERAEAVTWARLEDKFHSNPKIVEAGNAATGLYACALSYCGDHLTDGFVPRGWAMKAGSSRERTRLTEVGLWRPVVKGETAERVVRRQGQEPFGVSVAMPSDGFFIDDFLEFNPSRREVEVKREANAEKQRRHREKQERDESGRYAPASDEGSNSVSHSAPSPSPSSLPSYQSKAKATDQFSLRDLTDYENSLGAERFGVFVRLLELAEDADEGTPGVFAALCKKLPAPLIDEVRVAYRGGTRAGKVVNALKQKQVQYKRSFAA